MSKQKYIQTVIVLSMLLLGYVSYPYLPEQVPSHWNFAGEPDAWMSKTKAVWFYPGMAIGILLLFSVISKMDPRRDKYRLFQKTWEILQTVILSFFAYLYFVTLYVTIYAPEVNMGQFVVGGIGLMFLLIGNYLGKIKQNYFIGIKTPWALHDEENWDKTQRMGGWCFFISGITLLLAGVFNIFMVQVMIASIVLAAIFPFIYSYYLFARKKRTME